MTAMPTCVIEIRPSLAGTLGGHATSIVPLCARDQNGTSALLASE